jgi:1,4-dihydroxy-2-naphthoate octaprenyltransferase
LNNMRDIESDRLSNKLTLAGYFGPKQANTYQQLLVVFAMALIGIYSVLTTNSYMSFLLIAFVPFCVHLNSVRKINNPKDYDPQLKVLALSTFLLAIIFSICNIIV